MLSFFPVDGRTISGPLHFPCFGVAAFSTFDDESERALPQNKHPTTATAKRAILGHDNNINRPLAGNKQVCLQVGLAFLVENKEEEPAQLVRRRDRVAQGGSQVISSNDKKTILN